MEKRIKILSFIFALMFCVSSVIRPQNGKFTLNDANRLTSISGLQISPDGESAIFMISRRDLEKNTSNRSLVLLDIKTGKQEVLGQEIQGLSSPVWTSDGTGISFIARDGDSRQVHILNIKSRDLKVVTSSEQNIIRFSWSPDGRRLAYFTKDEKPENTGANEFNDAFEVGNNDYLAKAPPLNTSVYLVNTYGSNARKITPKGFTVATGLSTSTLSWSSDGKLLAFTRFPTSFSGDSDLGKNYVYNVITGEFNPGTSNSGKESNPVFRADSQYLTYRYPRNGVAANMSDWHQVKLNTGVILNITRAMDRSISSIFWLKDGTALLRGIDNWGSAIWQMKDGEFSKINIGDLSSISGWSVASDGSMVLCGKQKNLPNEVYYKADIDDDPVQLTSYNDFVKNMNLGKQEGFKWESSDGLQPNGIITYPPDFNPKNKYPLVLIIHGGPTASSIFGFDAIVQAMVAKDWITFEPNYRGSNNLGNEFQSSISKDPSEGPGHDIIAGVNALKEKPYVDEDKICVSGWSYGGWMTSWLIGRYPKVWSAAVAGAAPVDFTDMYSLNDLNRMRRHSIVESPYVGENLDWAYNNSPISNFSKIKTPTLIMSKTGDYRVTITGSYKLFGALRDNNIPVQFIAYPGSGHFPDDPVRSMDVYKRWMEWLEKYLSSKNSVEID